MDKNVLLIVASLLAGVMGTGVGGMLGVLFCSGGGKATARVMCFAGGVMLGVVCFEMLPEAMQSVKLQNVRIDAAVAVAAAIAGALAVGLVSKLIDLVEKRRSSGGTGIAEVLSGKAVTQAKTNGDIFRAGVVMLVAIALHNLPEGMAIGASGAFECKAGVLVAILIAVHNIPEGMAIGAPLAGGGMNAAKCVLLAALAGGATVPGALLGLAAGGAGALAGGICMALAAGAMLYVTFFDIIPQGARLAGKVPSLSLLAGLLVAATFVFLF